MDINSYMKNEQGRGRELTANGKFGLPLLVGRESAQGDSHGLDRGYIVVVTRWS